MIIMLANDNNDQEEVDDVDDAGEGLCVVLPFLFGDSTHNWVGSRYVIVILIITFFIVITTIITFNSSYQILIFRYGSRQPTTECPHAVLVVSLQVRHWLTGAVEHCYHRHNTYHYDDQALVINHVGT